MKKLEKIAAKENKIKKREEIIFIFHLVTGIDFHFRILVSSVVFHSVLHLRQKAIWTGRIESSAPLYKNRSTQGLAYLKIEEFLLLLIHGLFSYANKISYYSLYQIQGLYRFFV